MKNLKSQWGKQMTKKVLKLALEALNDLAAWHDGEVGGHMDEPYAAEVARRTITAIKEALAQPEQEPVAWEQFYPDMGKPQIEQPKVRTGDCLLVGVCASEGHKIQVKQEQEEYLSEAYRLANELRCYLAIAPAPQQRTWVGLTDEEIDKAWRSVDHTIPYAQFRIDVARAIETKLRSKNENR